MTRPGGGISESPRGGALFKLLVFLAVLLAVLALAWMLFLPAVLMQQVRQRTGFDATVESLAVNPFTGTVRLRGLVVMNPPTFPEREFLRVREFTADAEVFSLWSDRLVFSSVVLDVPSVTLVRRDNGQSNAEAFQNHLDAAAEGRAAPPTTRPPRRFLIRRLSLRLDRIVVADYSTRLPVSREYPLKLNQKYTDVTDVKELLAPLAWQSLAPVAEALSGLVPGDLGHVINDTVKDATKAGGALLKSTGRKAEEKVKGYFDALEESKKP